jgi:hypothetical protein
MGRPNYTKDGVDSQAERIGDDRIPAVSSTVSSLGDAAGMPVSGHFDSARSPLEYFATEPLREPPSQGINGGSTSCDGTCASCHNCNR